MNLLKQKQNEDKQVTRDELESIISRAIEKIGGQNKNDICRFLPSLEGDGYMHHFTLRKMLHHTPTKLYNMINKFIIDNNPTRFPPKKRAPKGSKKQSDQITLSTEVAEELLAIVRKIDRKDLAVKLTPKKSLNLYKRELIRSIKQNQVRVELWDRYVEAVKVIQSCEQLKDSDESDLLLDQESFFG